MLSQMKKKKELYKSNKFIYYKNIMFFLNIDRFEYNNISNFNSNLSKPEFFIKLLSFFLCNINHILYLNKIKLI